MINAALAALAFSLPLSIAGMNAALGGVTLAFLLRDRRALLACLHHPVVLALAAYCAAALLCSLGGLGPAASLARLPKDLHKIWAAAVLLAAFRAAPRTRCAEALAAGLAVAALAGVYQSLFMHLPTGEWIRAHGFVHPVTYGELLALSLLGVFCFAVEGRRGALPLLGLLSAAFVLNQTRGAFLAAGAGVVALGWIQPKLRRWLGPLFLAAIAVVLIWEFLPTHRGILLHYQTYGLSLAKNEQFNRLIFWKVAWRMFLDHPWLGVGPGHYATAYETYYQGVIAGQKVWGSAHNLYLQQLAERGLLGLAALAGVIWTMTRGAYRAAGEGALGRWGWAAAACFWAMNFTEAAFQNEQITTFFLFIWAWSQASAERA